ncbi:two-component sensor histidine kinase [Nonomuraea sp. WAC 01424]|uniref:sensor histidine kinase n=1 Tax=Nonomuraea sp. WAC 01424 TaxID=2203200 RepID=UPI000F799BB9|nr:histidine kinase [Nonomuraea sp. WAC 01424]RSN04370.1 two-component sensor histidine kinase [Nonomuraea sp. WAC 01424]
METTDRLVSALGALARRSPVPADALLATVLFLATLGPGQVLASGRPERLVLQAALVAPLAWRRRAPMAVFCAIAAAAAIQWLLDVQLPADAALLVALYTVAARRSWRWSLAAGLTLEAGALLAAIRWAPPGRFPFTAATLTTMAAAALTTGLWMRARRAYVTSLEHDREQRARLAVAEERARMTRDVHDIVTHNLSVMVALADSAAYVRHRAPDRAAAAVEQIAATGRQALADMRRTLAPGEQASTLRPAPGITQLGPLTERMRAAGLPTRLEVTGDPKPVPAAAQLTIYRLTQESLTNVLKHAPGATAKVKIHLTRQHATLEITNTPSTPRRLPHPEPPPTTTPEHLHLEPSPTTTPEHLHPGRPSSNPPRRGQTAPSTPSGRGLAGMSERVAAYGGTLHAGPLPDTGWRVAANLNLTDTLAATPDTNLVDDFDADLTDVPQGDPHGTPSNHLASRNRA